MVVFRGFHALLTGAWQCNVSAERPGINNNLRSAEALCAPM
jgi:hypothetical protein